MPAMKHISGNVLEEKLPNMAELGPHAFLDDFATSDDVEKPMTAGLFRLEAGEAVTYDYTYHEFKLIIDGEFHVTDDTGQTVKATKGDLFYFPKGSVITFSSPSFGVGYFCGQRGEGEA
ncbi:cupin domain-containing protein [uncultured Roseovarius sp.]|uniref:cupin domain-containing protein n=1 Tax=uncultured Roseovarius sp. TaxID=293344 RepID=UPI0026098C3A|nr:cupin domain-containing protein [uncultured Roseovarius sp.]